MWCANPRARFHVARGCYRGPQPARNGHRIRHGSARARFDPAGNARQSLGVNVPRARSARAPVQLAALLVISPRL